MSAFFQCKWPYRMARIWTVLYRRLLFVQVQEVRSWAVLRLTYTLLARCHMWVYGRLHNFMYPYLYILSSMKSLQQLQRVGRLYYVCSYCINIAIVPCWMTVSAGGHTNTERGFLAHLRSRLLDEFSTENELKDLHIEISEADAHPLIYVWDQPKEWKCMYFFFDT